jgi:hypothetical protein
LRAHRKRHQNHTQRGGGEALHEFILRLIALRVKAI